MEGGGGLAAGVSARLSPAKGRRFALAVGAVFVVLGAALWWRRRLVAAAAVAAVGTALIVAGLVIPGRLGPVYRAWMGLAAALSRFTTPVFMAIVYFAVLTPAGLLLRRLGKNPLAARRAGASVWMGRDGGAKSSMERQF